MPQKTPKLVVYTVAVHSPASNRLSTRRKYDWWSTRSTCICTVESAALHGWWCNTRARWYQLPGYHPYMILLLFCLLCCCVVVCFLWCNVESIHWSCPARSGLNVGDSLLRSKVYCQVSWLFISVDRTIHFDYWDGARQHQCPQNICTSTYVRLVESDKAFAADKPSHNLQQCISAV